MQCKLHPKSDKEVKIIFAMDPCILGSEIKTEFHQKDMD